MLQPRDPNARAGQRPHPGGRYLHSAVHTFRLTAIFGLCIGAARGKAPLQWKHAPANSLSDDDAIPRRIRSTTLISRPRSGPGKTIARLGVALTRCPAPNACSCPCIPAAAPSASSGSIVTSPARCSRLTNGGYWMRCATKARSPSNACSWSRKWQVLSGRPRPSDCGRHCSLPSRMTSKHHWRRYSGRERAARYQQQAWRYREGRSPGHNHR
jgi:hypothetical protein